MNKKDQAKFDKQYQEHVQALKLQGYAKKTVDAYSRAIRRLVEITGQLPENLVAANLKIVKPPKVRSLPDILTIDEV